MKKPILLCVLCARGNSKGVKNKNLIKLGSKSLINISFLQAKSSKIFNKIVLTTDSKKIIAKHSHLKFDNVIKRPKKLSTDKASKIEAIKHALKQTENLYKLKFDYIFDLDVSSPLRNILDIVNSYKYFLKKKASNLITVTRAKKNPYFNMIEITNKKPKLVIQHKTYLSRQMAPKIYEMNASIYIWNRNSLLRKKIINSKTAVFHMPPERSIDIDDSFDYKIVKKIYENKKFFK